MGIPRRQSWGPASRYAWKEARPKRARRVQGFKTDPSFEPSRALLREDVEAWSLKQRWK